MTHKLLFIAAIVFISAVVLAGQNPAPATQPPAQPQAPAAPKATIEGTVVRSGSGQPLKGVQITVQRTDSTGAAGRGGNRGAAANAPAGLGALGDLFNTIVGGARGGSTTVSTDAAGHFVVSGLEAGQYRIAADREGLIHQEFGRRTSGGRGTSVAIASGQRFSANFQMDPAGVITGRVRDTSGEPVFRATVQAYRY